MATSDHGSSKTSGAGVLFFAGTALMAAGAGFAFAPHYSWQVVKIARQASALGLENGTLFVGGLVLFGLGLVTRAVAGAAKPRDNSSEFSSLQSELSLSNEQIANKLAQLRAGLNQVGESVSSLAAQQAAQAQQPSTASAEGEGVREAVFRLAASLDKLHAHFDERLHAVDLQLRSGFETLLAASSELRRTLESAPAARATAPHAVHVPSSNPADPFAPVPEPQQAAGIDFYQTMQKLDAIAGEASPAPARGRQPQAPFPSSGQGQSLDALLPEEYRNRY